jgi:formiminoglutamase
LFEHIVSQKSFVPHSPVREWDKTFLEIYTTRPDAALFFTRHDPNDPRLGEVVRTDPAAYATAQVVILGCPQEEGVRRNGGRLGAAQAPTEIRRQLYRLTVTGLEQLRIFDLGDTIIQPTLEETHALHQTIVRQILTDGKTLIVLGGGNDISYPDCAALSQVVVGDLLAFNLDTHYDVRDDMAAGQPCHSGTPYRQLLNEGWLHPHNFYEMGHHPFANSPVYSRYLAEQGVHSHSLRALREAGLLTVFADILQKATQAAIFWGFDLDVVCAADAPGVSAPNPIGMPGAELCQLAEIAGAEPRTRLIEFSEVNPAYDLDSRTARLTAIAISYFLQGVGARG